MHPVFPALVLVAASAVALPYPSTKRSLLDADKIMSDVYNLKGFGDFGELKISPELYDDVLNQFRRFERDFPDVEEENTTVEKEEEAVTQRPSKKPQQQRPHEKSRSMTPPIFPGFKTRFFRMF